MAARKNLNKNLKSSSSSEDKAVEVLDERGWPIAVMSLSEVHKQHLRHRSVMVLAYDAQGKVFLQKRSESKPVYPGRWDLSATGHVRAGESSEDAALRELAEGLGIEAQTLKLRHSMPAGPSTGWEFVTLYSAGKVTQPPRPNSKEIAGGYFFDPQELECLLVGFRDLLTPGLVYCWEKGLMFPATRRPKRVVTP